MSADWFLKLKEFDSLTKMRINYLRGIKDQEDRLYQLNIKRQEQLTSFNLLSNELMNLNQDYFETEKKLKTAEEQGRRLRERGSDESKVIAYLAEAADLEHALFDKLERTDQIQQEIDEIKTFLTGLDKTTEEIEGEVKSEIKDLNTQISGVDLRLKLIQDELPEDFKITLKRTLEKNLAVGPFTRVENSCCFFCRFQLSRLDESEIDMQRILKICPQCSRIFLPYGS